VKCWEVKKLCLFLSLSLSLSPLNTPFAVLLLLAFVAASSAVSPFAKIYLEGILVSGWPTLFSFYNQTFPNPTKSCRMGTLQLSMGASATTADFCNMPVSYSGVKVVSFALQNASDPTGSVTLPAPLLNSAPASFYVLSGSSKVHPPSPSLRDAPVMTTSLGALQLAPYYGAIMLAFFQFDSAARCQTFLLDIDTTCTVQSNCVAGGPLVVSVSSPTQLQLCVIDNFLSLDFDSARVAGN
jgi:hypothetical protein